MSKNPCPNWGTPAKIESYWNGEAWRIVCPLHMKGRTFHPLGNGMFPTHDAAPDWTTAETFDEWKGLWEWWASDPEVKSVRWR